MVDLYAPGCLRQVVVDGRHVWMYEAQMTIGTLYLVQHETPLMNIVDDYIGWSNQKADAAFRRISTLVLRGKD